MRINLNIIPTSLVRSKMEYELKRRMLEAKKNQTHKSLVKPFQKKEREI